MSLGGGQTISPVADSNKYAQIMELMRMRQNMTPGSSYTGGFNSSAPASVSAAPSSYYEELLRQQALLNANSNRGGGRGEPAEPGYEAPSTQSFAEGLASAGINYANTPFGYLLPGSFVTEALGNYYKDSKMADAAKNGGYTGTYTGYAAFGDRPNNTMTEAQTQAAIDGTGGGPLSGESWGGGGADRGYSSPVGGDSGSSGAFGGGFGGGGGYGGGSSDAGSSARGGGGFGGTGSGIGGGDGGGDGGGGMQGNSGGNFGGGFGGGDGGGYAKGGKVTMDRLQGPNPMGPDDGYGGLDDGEFVINAKSVNKYGIELMNAINAGKISKGKLRGLLEG